MINQPEQQEIATKYFSVFFVPCEKIEMSIVKKKGAIVEPKKDIYKDLNY